MERSARKTISGLPVPLLTAGALLLVFLASASFIANKKNSTWDESAHILSGYAYLTNGMDYLSPLHHPALGRSINAAIPAALLDLDFNAGVRPEEEPDSDFFPYSVKFIYKNKITGKSILFLSRLSNILLGAMLAIYVFRWAREFWGDNGALLSLFLYALCPNILAHSSLATTDLPITAFFFISTYYLYRLAASGVTLRNTALAGAFLAFAFATKHTAFLLIPVFVVSFILSFKRGNDKCRVVLGYAAIILIVYIMIWAVYGFRYRMEGPSYVPLFWTRFSGSFFEPVFALLREWKLLPEAYLYGVLGVISGAGGGGKSAFLMGQYSTTGWWYYFIAAFLIKTPAAIFFFLAAAILYASFDKLSRRRGDNPPAILWAALPALLIFSVMSVQKVNIGLRHILPVYPFIFLLCGYISRIRTPSMAAAKTVFASFIIWYAYASVSITPHQLAYFNEFIGGPKNGYKYLVDSNLDWGQDLAGLKEYMTDKEIKSIKLAYFGLNDPADFGIDYDYMPSYRIMNSKNAKESVELEGWFGISATMLQGVYLDDRDLYAIFRDLSPVDVIGYSIFVYKLPAGRVMPSSRVMPPATKPRPS